LKSQASAPVAGTSTSLAWAAIGQGTISAPAFVTDQSEAQITAEPATTDVNTILNANAAIKTAFTTGKTPTYFGIGELGGAYSTSGSGSKTENASIQMTIDLTKFSPLHDLIIGFYSGTAFGKVATDPAFNLSLDVNINGTDHISSFTTVAAANAFFQNNAHDYGALSGTSLQLDISLSITESAAGGYDFGMLIDQWCNYAISRSEARMSRTFAARRPPANTPVMPKAPRESRDDCPAAPARTSPMNRRSCCRTWPSQPRDCGARPHRSRPAGRGLGLQGVSPGWCPASKMQSAAP
jgi:hypothetical protein